MTRDLAEHYRTKLNLSCEEVELWKRDHARASVVWMLEDAWDLLRPVPDQILRFDETCRAELLTSRASDDTILAHDRKIADLMTTCVQVLRLMSEACSLAQVSDYQDCKIDVEEVASMLERCLALADDSGRYAQRRDVREALEAPAESELEPLI